MCAKLSYEKDKFGDVRSFRVIDIAQGPTGLPTVVVIEAYRRNGIRQEAIVMQAFGYVSGFDDLGR